MNHLPLKTKTLSSVQAVLFTKQVNMRQLAETSENRRVGVTLTVVRGDIKDAIRKYQKSPSPDILLVDISGHEFPLTLLDDLAEVCSPDIQVIVIGQKDSVSLYRSLLARGVEDYLVTPVPQTVLEASLGRLLGNSAPKGRTAAGKVVGIIGSSGGAGATTIAANMAAALSGQAHRQVAALDLTGRGGMAVLFGKCDDGGLTKLLHRKDGLDDLVLERTTVKIRDRLHFLGLGEALVRYPDLEKFWSLKSTLAARSHFLVMDMGVPSSEEDLGISSETDVDYLILTSSLQSVKRTKWILETRKSSGRDAPRLLLNQPHPAISGGLSVREIERLLGQQITYALPYLPKIFTSAENVGVPAYEGSRKAAHHFNQLAAGLTGQLEQGQRSGSALSNFWRAHVR